MYGGTRFVGNHRSKLERELSQHFRRQQIRCKAYRGLAVCSIRSLAYRDLIAVQSLRCRLDPIVIETYKAKVLLVLPIPTSKIRHLSARSSFHTMPSVALLKKVQ
jgi:hypothetical protein